MFGKKSLSASDIGAQVVMELPSRELVCATILVYAPIDIDVDVDIRMNNIANNAFRDAEVNLLRIDRNHLIVNVERTLSDLDLGVFCNQIASALSAQCLRTLR
ncbi:MAG TPA: hypothetical protein VGL99_15360 [Chloroflexota bacterium]|jgi:hypothetical protein